MINYPTAKYPQMVFFTIMYIKPSCRFTKCSWNIHFTVVSWSTSKGLRQLHPLCTKTVRFKL